MSKQGKRSRRKFTAEQKAVILRRHLVDKVAVSDLCDEYKIHPNLFYLWQQQLFEHAERAMQKPDGSEAAQRLAAQERKIATLEAKVAKKESVIAQVTEEYVALKELGEL